MLYSVKIKANGSKSRREIRQLLHRCGLDFNSWFPIKTTKGFYAFEYPTNSWNIGKRLKNELELAILPFNGEMLISIDQYWNTGKGYISGARIYLPTGHSTKENANHIIQRNKRQEFTRVHVLKTENAIANNLGMQKISKVYRELIPGVCAKDVENAVQTRMQSHTASGKHNENELGIIKRQERQFQADRIEQKHYNETTHKQEIQDSQDIENGYNVELTT